MTHDGGALKELLGLEREPVALRWSAAIPVDVPRIEEKARFCRKLDLASRGRSFYATLEEEACMGGARYCGLADPKQFPATNRTGEFLVRRGIYKRVSAVQRSWQGNTGIEPGLFHALSFAPLATAPFEPDVVFILCDAKQAMELLHANAYDSGTRALGADARPICSSMAAMPYLTGKMTYGFGDIGSRPHMRLDPGTVMVSISGGDLSRIVSNLQDMRSKEAFRA
jgi:uncharacterized protein (DUF169 family)